MVELRQARQEETVKVEGRAKEGASAAIPGTSLSPEKITKFFGRSPYRPLFLQLTGPERDDNMLWRQFCIGCVLETDLGSELIGPREFMRKRYEPFG